jgi:hypothetical protein
MVLALYYFNFPEIIISHPLAPSSMTDLIIELAASLTGILLSNLYLIDST